MCGRSLAIKKRCAGVPHLLLRALGNDDTFGNGLPDLPQHRFDRLALVRRQGRLRRDGITDIIALDRKPGLDAGGEIVAREGFVEPP